MLGTLLLNISLVLYMIRTDSRIVVYLSPVEEEDQLFRDRITIAAKTMGLSVSGLMRAAAAYALDNVKDFRRSMS